MSFGADIMRFNVVCCTKVSVSFVSRRPRKMCEERCPVPRDARGHWPRSPRLLAFSNRCQRRVDVIMCIFGHTLDAQRGHRTYTIRWRSKSQKHVECSGQSVSQMRKNRVKMSNTALKWLKRSEIPVLDSVKA